MTALYYCSGRNLQLATCNDVDGMSWCRSAITRKNVRGLMGGAEEVELIECIDRVAQATDQFV